MSVVSSHVHPVVVLCLSCCGPVSLWLSWCHGCGGGVMPLGGGAGLCQCWWVVVLVHHCHWWVVVMVPHCHVHCRWVSLSSCCCHLLSSVVMPLSSVVVPLLSVVMPLLSVIMPLCCHWVASLSVGGSGEVGWEGAHHGVIKRMTMNNKAVIICHLVATSLSVMWHLDSMSKKGWADNAALSSLHHLDLVGTHSVAYIALPHCSCCAAVVVGHRQLVVAISDGGGQCWGALWVVVVVEEEEWELLMVSKLSVGKHQCSIWVWLRNNTIYRPYIHIL